MRMQYRQVRPVRCGSGEDWDAVLARKGLYSGTTNIDEMTFAENVKSLLFDPKRFFADPDVTRSLKLPVLFTAVLAVLTAISSYSVSATAGDLIGMSEMNGILGVIGAVTGFISIFLAWVFVTIVFFLFVKGITHTKTGLKPFLAVTGYASLPMSIGTVLMLVIAAVSPHAFDGWMGFLLNLIVLFWCVPVWIYGFSTAGEVPVRAVALALLVPLLLMVAFSAWSVASSLETMAAMQSAGGAAGTAGTTGTGGMQMHPSGPPGSR